MKIKTLRYSKQQIQEAISYWTKILENKSIFLDALVDDFGYDYVFNERRKMQIRLAEIENISHLANSIIFGNKLMQLKAVEDAQHEHFNEQNIFMSYGFNIYFDPETDKWKLLKEDGQTSDGNIYKAPQLYVSSRALSVQMHLITFANIVVHEVIHQKIVEDAKSDKLLQNASNEYDSHDQEFIAMMNNVNATFGLNVNINGSASYDQESFDAMKEYAGDDYALDENDSISDKFKKVRNISDNLIQVDLY